MACSDCAYSERWLRTKEEAGTVQQTTRTGTEQRGELPPARRVGRRRWWISGACVWGGGGGRRNGAVCQPPTRTPAHNAAKKTRMNENTKTSRPGTVAGNAA